MENNSRREFFKELGIIVLDQAIPRPEIPILAYHDVNKNGDGSIYTVTTDEFRKHVLTLEKECFRPMSLDDYFEGSFRTWDNRVVFTFDDGYPGQFDTDSRGRVDPGSAYGILKDVYGDKARADFFISFDKAGSAFGLPRKERELLEKLREEGCGIGHHTYDHFPALDKLDYRQVKEQIEKADEKFYQLLGNEASAVKIFCYPGGEFPKDKKSMDLIRQSFMGAVRTRRNFNVVAAPSPPTNELRYEVPRIGVYTGEKGYKAIRRAMRGPFDSLDPQMPPHLRR